MHTNTEIFINGQPYILDTTYMYLDITIQHLIRGVGHDSLLGGGKSVGISLCRESIKHQKENVPNINWPITLIQVLGDQNTLPTASQFLSWGGGRCHSAPFSHAAVYG